MSVEVTNETIWDIDAKAFSDLGLWVMDQMRVSTQSDLDHPVRGSRSHSRAA